MTCRLNFWYYYFPFWVFALWNVMPSRLFSPFIWLDPPNLSRCTGLSLSICKCFLPVLICPLMNNFVDPLPWLSWSELPYFYLDLFSSHFQPPTHQPVQVLLQFFHVCIMYDFFVNYTVISKKSNSWFHIPPNIIYVG